MNITNIGAGYVEIITGACLAELGKNVFCLDVDHSKIDTLDSGGVPLHDSELWKSVQAMEDQIDSLSSLTSLLSRRVQFINVLTV